MFDNSFYHHKNHKNHNWRNKNDKIINRKLAIYSQRIINHRRIVAPLCHCGLQRLTQPDQFLDNSSGLGQNADMRLCSSMVRESRTAIELRLSKKIISGWLRKRLDPTESAQRLTCGQPVDPWLKYQNGHFMRKSNHLESFKRSLNSFLILILLMKSSITSINRLITNDTWIK